jgi:hypothetical protein
LLGNPRASHGLMAAGIGTTGASVPQFGDVAHRSSNPRPTAVV